MTATPHMTSLKFEHRQGSFVPRFLPGICLAASLCPSAAVFGEEDPPLGTITPNFRVLGELRGRVEGFDYFKPPLNKAKGVTVNQNDYVFGALRARLGIAMTTLWVDGLVQGE